MSPVHIVTDSTADLPEHLYERFGIQRVPLKVLIGSDVYQDGIEISPEQFYDRLAHGDTAKTSQPAPAEFAQKFAELSKEDTPILCLTLSSVLSGTYQSARIASKMISGNINVIDTRSACWGVGLMAIAAARAAADGKSYVEITELVNKLIPKMKILFLVDSLHYLQQGGRIGKAQAFLGSLLNIKPLLTVSDGLVYPYEKIRGKNKGLERIIQIIEKDTEGAKISCAVLHGGDPQAGEYLYQKASTRLNCQEIWQGNVGPVIGCHTGPGVSGIIYYTI